MSETKVIVQLPHSIYERLHDVAEASGQPFDDVLLQTIKNGMPPSLQKVPDQFHDQLLALNKFDDKNLWEAFQGKWPDEDKSHLAEQADLATLRRAYAFALLKWRGHPMPEPSELLF